MLFFTWFYTKIIWLAYKISVSDITYIYFLSVTLIFFSHINFICIEMRLQLYHYGEVLLVYYYTNFNLLNVKLWTIFVIKS